MAQLVAASWDDRAAAAWAQRRADPVAALDVGRDLRDEAAADGDDARLGRALTITGAAHRLRGDFPAGLRDLREAIRLLERASDGDLAVALAEAGIIESYVGEHDSAVERLLEALKLHERAGDRAGQAEALNQLGVIFFHHGDLDEAERAHERSAALRAALGATVDLAGSRNNLAKVATARGDHDTALTHLAAAVAGWEGAGEWRGLGMALHNTAVVHRDRGDDDQAATYFEAAVALYDTVGHAHGACEARWRLGEVLVRRGRVDEGVALMARAHDEASAQRMLAEAAGAAESLAEAEEDRGDPAAALAWLKRLRALERELFDERSEQRLRALQVTFQLDRLERDSTTDPLTELANRRELDRRLAEHGRRARETGTELAAVLFDLDDFKQVNDRFSHAIGDEVLRIVGGLLRAGTRPTDVCARYGGEEFVVLLPGCGLAGAQAVGEQLRRRIRDHDWTAVAAGLVVTASVGVATLDDVRDVGALVPAADRAMYEAKRDGKDQVRA